jgi:hypothetical protein
LTIVDTAFGRAQQAIAEPVGEKVIVRAARPRSSPKAGWTRSSPARGNGQGGDRTDDEDGEHQVQRDLAGEVHPHRHRRRPQAAKPRPPPLGGELGPEGEPGLADDGLAANETNSIATTVVPPGRTSPSIVRLNMAKRMTGGTTPPMKYSGTRRYRVTSEPTCRASNRAVPTPG